MSDRKVVLSEERKKAESKLLKPDLDMAWKWVGRLGVLLLVVGLGDFALGWYPLNFGSVEWEFGTIAATFSGLPLVTMGFAAFLGAGLARGQRWVVLTAAWALAVLAVFVGAMYLVFLLDVPVALRSVEGVAELGIKKAIAKTSLLGLSFAGIYGWAAVAVLRHSSIQRRSTDA